MAWYALVGPKALLFVAVILAPFLFAVWISLHQYHPISADTPFVGLENYRRLATDSVFHHAVLNTTLYTAGVILLSVPLSLFVAVLLNTRIRGTKFYSAAIFTPVITSWVVVSFIWGWIYHPEFGFLNQFLAAAGLPTPKWHRGSDTALLSIVLLGTWKTIGFNMVIFLAGIRSIPAEYYEAAELDGAGPVQRFRYVTLPLLKPTTFFVTILTLIGAFRIFTPVFIMTEGGPGYGTRTIVFQFYKSGFQNFEMGYASAMAVVLLVIVFVFSVVQQRTWGRDTDFAT